MSSTDDSKEVRFYHSYGVHESGAPQVGVVGGSVNLWPAGPGGAYLSLSIEDWRYLNGLVEASYTKAKAAGVA